MESVPHAKISYFFYVLLFVHYEKEADVLVTHDVKMVWGIPGLAGPAPDIAVIRGIQNKEQSRDVFDVLQEGARPCLVIEVVSPKYEEIRRNDYVDKKEIYERAGIPEYLIIEPCQVPGAPIRPWIGYRLGFDGRYQGIEPDGEGRLLSKTTGLLFGIAEDGGFQVTDTRTGERLLNQSQLAAAREDAEERATRESERADREAEARKAADAEIARLWAELERISKV